MDDLTAASTAAQEDMSDDDDDDVPLSRFTKGRTLKNNVQIWSLVNLFKVLHEHLTVLSRYDYVL